MKKSEKFARITITLPPDVAQWVKEKEQALNNRDRRLRTSVSAIIADAVEEMKAREEQAAIIPGQAMPDRIILNNDSGKAPAHPRLGAEITNPRKTSDGGSKTAGIRYQAKPRGRS
jgi:glycerate-2-kinase